LPTQKKRNKEKGGLSRNFFIVKLKNRTWNSTSLRYSTLVFGAFKHYSVDKDSQWCNILTILMLFIRFVIPVNLPFGRQEQGSMKTRMWIPCQARN